VLPILVLPLIVLGISRSSQNFLLYHVDDKDLFTANIESHNLETRHDNNLYTPQVNLAIYQKGTYYSGITFYNKLPSDIKNVSGNLKIFKSTLKKYLYMKSFYTLDEYLEHES
jgi:hypothetical protein